MSDERILWDETDPGWRLRIQEDIDHTGLVNLAEERMPHHGAVHAKPCEATTIAMTPAQARWLRDTLNSMDLEGEPTRSAVRRADAEADEADRGL